MCVMVYHVSLKSRYLSAGVCGSACRIVLPAAHYNILCSCTEHCVTVVTDTIIL